MFHIFASTFPGYTIAKYARYNYITRMTAVQKKKKIDQCYIQVQAEDRSVSAMTNSDRSAKVENSFQQEEHEQKVAA